MAPVAPAAPHHHVELGEHVLLELGVPVAKLGPDAGGPLLRVDDRVDEGYLALEDPLGVPGRGHPHGLAEAERREDVLEHVPFRDDHRIIHDLEQGGGGLDDLAQGHRPLHDHPAQRRRDVAHRDALVAPDPLHLLGRHPQEGELPDEPGDLGLRGLGQEVELAPEAGELVLGGLRLDLQLSLEPRNLVLRGLELVFGRDEVLPRADAPADQGPVAVGLGLGQPQLVLRLGQLDLQPGPLRPGPVLGLCQVQLQLGPFAAGPVLGVQEVGLELLHLQALHLDEVLPLGHPLPDLGVDLHDPARRPARHDGHPIRVGFDHPGETADLLDGPRRGGHGLEADVLALDGTEGNERPGGFVMGGVGGGSLGGVAQRLIAGLCGFLLRGAGRGEAGHQGVLLLLRRAPGGRHEGREDDGERAHSAPPVRGGRRRCGRARRRRC